MSEMSEVKNAVIARAMTYSNHWQSKGDSYWFYRLLEEVGELGASLANDHEHSPGYELEQIASICINWLEKRRHEQENK